MRELFEQITGQFLQRFISPMQAMAAVLLAFGLWCFDYAIAEWPHRKHYSIPLLLVGVAILFAIFAAATDVAFLIGCGVLAAMYYGLLRWKVGPRSRRDEVPRVK